MDVYKTREFARWARKQELGDAQLCVAVAEIARGLFEADLGGNLLKKRVARPGRGKSGGFRALVVTDRNSLWFFVYGFAKNERSNISKDEETALKKLAAALLTMPYAPRARAIRAAELIEVNCDA